MRQQLVFVECRMAQVRWTDWQETRKRRMEAEPAGTLEWKQSAGRAGQGVVGILHPQKLLGSG